MMAGDARDGFGAARPAMGLEVERGQRPGAGAAQNAEAEDRNAPVPCERGRVTAAPDAVLPEDMAIHAEVMAQHMTRDPFHHTLGQAVIDHPRERHLERGISHHILDPRPEVQHRLEPRIGGEIGQPAVRGIDDVIHLCRIGLDRQIGMAKPRLLQRAAQRGFVGGPPLGLGGEKDRGHGLGPVWWSSAVCGYGRFAPDRRPPSRPASPIRRS